MAIKSYSRIRVWCCLFLVLTRLQTVCPAVMFSLTNFVSSTEFPAEKSNKFVDRIFISISDKIKVDEKMRYFSDTISFYLNNVQEKILKNSNVNATNAGQGIFGGFFYVEDFGLHTVIIAMLLGANIGFLGNSLFQLCMKDFTTINFCTMLITSVLPISCYSYQEKFVTALKISGKTFSEKMWSILSSKKEEPTLIIPPPHDSVMQKVLKILFPGMISKNSAPHFRKCFRVLLEKSGINLSTLFSAISLAFVTNQLMWGIYNYFNKETVKEDFTDEELLEVYKDNEELYRTFEEWLTPRRRSIYEAEYDDISVV